MRPECEPWRPLTRHELRTRRAKARARVRRHRALAALFAIALLALLCLGTAEASSSPARQSDHRPFHLTAAPRNEAHPKPAAAAQQALRQALAAGVPKPMFYVYLRAAQRTGVPWQELAAIGLNESDHGREPGDGVIAGINDAGCCAGPAQLCVLTSCGDAWAQFGSGDVYDPLDAFTAAGRMLRYLAHIVGTRLDLQLAAYNAGPGAVNRYGDVPPYPETEAYVAKGLALSAKLGDHDNGAQPLAP